MKLKTGFVGIGAMGYSHLKAICDHHSAHAEVSAVCSTSEANIQRALALVPGARVFRDEAALIESELDAVFISTPNFTHVRLALLALRAGRHVFLEKPVGIMREECESLARSVEKTDRVVLIGHELRYSPFFQRIKNLIDEGEIGRPRMVWCREFRGPFQKKSRDWIQDAQQSGGTLVDKNCHHFDLMNWWVGSRPKRVSAFGGKAISGVTLAGRDVLDHASVSFEYENGVRGTLQLCMFAPGLQGEELEMGVIGDKGMLQTRLSELQILLWAHDAANQNPRIEKLEAQRGEGWGGHLGFAEIHEAFLRAILQNDKPLTTVSNCLDGTLLAIAAEESIRHGRTVELG
jgi:predicted dehydrogenase